MSADATMLQALHDACDAEDWAAAGDLLAAHARRINAAVSAARGDRAVLTRLHAEHMQLEQALLSRRDQVRSALSTLRRSNTAAHAYLKT
jgi:hypothetical protein